MVFNSPCLTDKKELIHHEGCCHDSTEELASPRVNGYLVKASSKPLLFFDSPLPGVNTPWDVMRISASIVFVFLLLLDVALAAAHSPVSILKLTSEDLSRNLKYVVPTGRVKVHPPPPPVFGRYVVPTGKDNVIVSVGRSKVIPAGRTILVLVVEGGWVVGGRGCGVLGWVVVGVWWGGVLGGEEGVVGCGGGVEVWRCGVGWCGGCLEEEWSLGGFGWLVGCVVRFAHDWGDGWGVSVVGVLWVVVVGWFPSVVWSWFVWLFLGLSGGVVEAEGREEEYKERKKLKEDEVLLKRWEEREKKEEFSYEMEAMGTE
ncbi:hypothetical protein Tco_1400933 [Tanacetum coccineum]